MNTVFDLLIAVGLLLGYISTRAYAGFLHSQIGKKKGPLRFSSVALPAEDIHNVGLIRISMGGQDKEKVRFLQRAGKYILYLLIIFVIGSLLFQGRRQVKDNQLSAIDDRR